MSAADNVTHIVFAPTNTDLQKNDFFEPAHDSRMDTGWEEVLWWGFGVGVRNGTWSSKSDGIKPSLKSDAPASLLEILEYAKSKGVRLMPYVYPIIVGFAPAGYGGSRPLEAGDDDDCSAAPWLYPSHNPHVNRMTCHSDLGSPEYQDWLVHALSSFYTMWGEYAGGYAFDGVFLGESHNNTMCLPLGIRVSW